MVRLSIIIISYNTRDITKKCLKTVVTSLEGADFTTEIIVVDNSSTDGSVDEIKKLIIDYPTPLSSSRMRRSELKKNRSSIKLRMTLIENKANFGFSKANNLAVKQAQGEVILFLNSDIEVIGDAIPKLYHFLTIEQKRFHFVGGKLYEKDGKTPQASCGPVFSLPVIFTFLFLRGDYFHITRYSSNAIKEVAWISGACIICRKNDFLKVGGFDENIFMYMDEIDLLYRANKIGLKVGFYPHAHFIHLGSASSGSRKHPILQVYKGYIYFYKKHRSSVELMILKRMLQLKAQISLAIGKLTGKTYLIETYEEAKNIVKNA